MPASPPALHVTLLRHGDLIVVDLAETGTLIPRSEVRVDDAFLVELASELETAGTQGNATRALARTGALVFSHLLTEPARRRLRDAPPSDLYLRLDERLVHVPWELCHDGERFLFERFRVGRQVITGQTIPEGPARRAQHDRLRVLVVADPVEDLPQATAEGERLCVLLDDLPGVDVTLLAGRSVRRIPLLAALQEHDVVHYAGHSHFDAADPAQSGWRLADGVLAASEIAKLRPPPFLVFSNSCAAGATTAWQPGYDARAYGVGSAFLMAGVPSYVGTFWVVHDEESVTCATAFYRTLAAGGRIGDALADARQAVHATHGDGFTWASYLMYGDPAARPLARVSRPQTRRDAGAHVPRAEVRYAVTLTGGVAAPAVDRVAESRPFVGRDAELERLVATFASVLDGAERCTALVSGPAGIGKTTLLDAFVERVADTDRAWIAHGQAVEQYGAGEAYLPLLEALGRLGASAGASLVDHLRRHAPTWLAQLPALIDPSEHEALARRTLGSTRDRMLRELADVLEAVTAERALVLVLEDLHWSDHATIEAIAYVAQRRTPARLLVVGTFRPAEVLAGEHPLRKVAQDLQARRRSVEVRLEVLGEADVAHYLRVRLGVTDVDRDLVRVLHARTEGHPLFLVNVVDFALREKLIAARDGRLELTGAREALAASIPEGLLPMIERQIEALPEADQQVLEVAAVAGAEFSVAGVATMLGTDADEIEERCECLAWRGQMLRAAGVEEWPDGTLAGRYRFVHALYQNVLYQRVSEGRRVRLHRRIAECKARAFGTRASEIAVELAAHFEAAREPRRALEHRVRAGDQAVDRHAEREAVEHYHRALDMIARLDDRAEDARELEVLVKLATRMMSTDGYAAPVLEEVFDRAYALSLRVSPGPHRAPLLRSLMSFHHVRARLDVGCAVAEELLGLCERGEEDEIALVQALYGLGALLYDTLELERAKSLLERALELYDPATHDTHVGVYGGYDPGVACRAWLGWILWARGEPDRALQVGQEAVALAEELAHPFSLAFAFMSLGLLHLNRGEARVALEPLHRGHAIADGDGFPHLRGMLRGCLGWAEMVTGDVVGGVARCADAIAELRSTGARLSIPGYFTIVAYGQAIGGDVARGLAVIDEGLEEARQTGQRLHAPQLWRARGDLLSGIAGQEAEAEACHRRGLEVARAMGAPMLELQAAIGLGRLLRGAGRTDEVRALIEPLYAQIREGADVAPMREARALLAL